jgi:hypothetical protein
VIFKAINSSRFLPHADDDRLTWFPASSSSAKVQLPPGPTLRDFSVCPGRRPSVGSGPAAPVRRWTVRPTAKCPVEELDLVRVAARAFGSDAERGARGASLFDRIGRTDHPAGVATRLPTLYLRRLAGRSPTDLARSGGSGQRAAGLNVSSPQIDRPDLRWVLEPPGYCIMRPAPRARLPHSALTICLDSWSRWYFSPRGGRVGPNSRRSRDRWSVPPSIPPGHGSSGREP